MAEEQYEGPERRICPESKFCQEAADRAVKKTFAILGVDIEKPESVEEFREDLRFGRKIRRAANQGFLAFVGAVAVATAAALWVGVTSSFMGNHH